LAILFDFNGVTRQSLKIAWNNPGERATSASSNGPIDIEVTAVARPEDEIDRLRRIPPNPGNRNRFTRSKTGEDTRDLWGLGSHEGEERGAGEKSLEEMHVEVEY